MRFELKTRSCRLSGNLHVAAALLIALLLVPAVSGWAVDTTEVAPPGDMPDSVAADVIPSPELTADTSLFDPPADPTIAGQVTNPVDLEQYLRQPPTAALFKSMFVPGLGQLGNRRYVKAAVIAGLEGWFISKAIYWGGQASDVRKEFDSATELSDRNRLYSLYDEKRKKRNKFSWFAGITIFVSMFDAYVDAHLSGSPADKRNEKFTFDVVPNEYGGVSANLAFNF